jgi:hypothetical protein
VVTASRSLRNDGSGTALDVTAWVWGGADLDAAADLASAVVGRWPHPTATAESDVRAAMPELTAGVVVVLRCGDDWTVFPETAGRVAPFARKLALEDPSSKNWASSLGHLALIEVALVAAEEASQDEPSSEPVSKPPAPTFFVIDARESAVWRCAAASDYLWYGGCDAAQSREWCATGGRETVGRPGWPRTTVPLADRFVSPYHYEIGFDGRGGCRIRDLESDNGTWVLKAPQAGDEVLLADSVVHVWVA